MAKRAFMAGFPLGVVLVVGFAVLIRFFPEPWFVETPQRVVLFVAQIVLAPVFVWIARGVGGAARAPGAVVLTWAVGAGLLTDGLLLGFWPGLYGQPVEAMGWVAATLLWAFGWIVVAGRVMSGRTEPEPVASGSG